MLLSEALSDYMYEEDSDAVKQAQQMGLVYKGFGRWADPQTNKVTHKTERGQLVPVDPGQQELPLGTPRVEPNKGIPGSRVDMPHGDPRQAGFRPQPPTEELPSQKEKASKLATMLKNHDWHHQYSDDYSVVKRGELEKKAIQQFVKGSGLDPKLAQKVYDKFAHPDYQGKGQDFGISGQQQKPNYYQGQKTGLDPVDVGRDRPTKSGKARDQFGRDIDQLKDKWKGVKKQQNEPQSSTGDWWDDQNPETQQIAKQASKLLKLYKQAKNDGDIELANDIIDKYKELRMTVQNKKKV